MPRTPRPLVLLVLAACIILSNGACSPSTLSRADAEALISELPHFAKQASSVPLREGGVEALQQYGYANSAGLPLNRAGDFAKSITLVRGSRDYLGLVAPIPPPIIKVTGIQGEEGATDLSVEFDWTWEDGIELPLSLFVSRGGTGRAVITRYDDGFRLTDSSIEIDPEGIEISERAAEEASVLSARAKERLREAHTPTTTLIDRTPRLVVSDTGVSGSSQWQGHVNISYGEISSFSAEPVFQRINIFRYGADVGVMIAGIPDAKAVVATAQEQRSKWRERFSDLLLVGEKP